MKQLFDNDPLFAHPRDSSGRFCTIERAEYERAKRENQFLRLEAEKYKRQAEVMQRESQRYKNELEALRTAISKAINN